MGRTLPWLAKATPGIAPASTKRAVPGKAGVSSKRQKIEDGTAKRRIARGFDDESLASPHNKAGRRHDDIFSSSPPLQEEPVREELMREGLDADDIYIMVEDEFYDVARTFTAHIHQQEYERLRREARERNAARTTSVARPVDGKSVLPKDKKMAKDRNEAAVKRKQKLAAVTGSAQDESDTDAGNDEEQDARWAGTTLGGLMLSPSKTQKSLMGLQGPTIRSRAAAGFKEAQITPTKQRFISRPAAGDDMSVTSEDDLDASPSAGPRTRSAENPGVNSTKHDNISRTPPARQETTQAVGGSTRTRTVNAVPSANRITKTEEGLTSKALSLVGTDLDDMDDLDNYLRPTPLINTRRALGNQTKVKTEDTAEKRKRNYDEIPIFLG